MGKNLAQVRHPSSQGNAPRNCLSACALFFLKLKPRAPSSPDPGRHGLSSPANILRLGVSPYFTALPDFRKRPGRARAGQSVRASLFDCVKSAAVVSWRAVATFAVARCRQGRRVPVPAVLPSATTRQRKMGKLAKSTARPRRENANCARALPPSRSVVAQSPPRLAPAASDRALRALRRAAE